MSEEGDNMMAPLLVEVERARLLAEKADNKAEVGVTGLEQQGNRHALLEEVPGVTPYPFGPQHNFGISITGAAVTVLWGLAKRGGYVYEIGTSAGITVADGEWLALEMTPGTDEGDDTFAYAAYASLPMDNGGKEVMPLHKFTVADGVAHWAKSTYFDGVFPTFGH
jgi:hypothetical protein